MGKAKYRLIGILFLSTLLGLAFVVPVTSSPPSWVGDGKYARYLGGFPIEVGTQGQPGYVKVLALASFNWSLSISGSDYRVDGGWNVSFYIDFNNTILADVSGGTVGYEIIRSTDSQIITPGGYDLFGLEQVGTQTVLWVEDTSILPTNVSIGGRPCVISSTLLDLPLPSPMNLSNVQVLKYYDKGTGVLMALNLVLNITELMGGLGGLGSLSMLTFPIPMISTNVVPFAWNPGGDPTLWLISIGVLLGVSVLFGLVIYARKR